jgi:hypothetical protein
MSSPQFDEEAILEVARDIRTPAIREKYLRQVCKDKHSLMRLEQRLKTRAKRWQFSLRSLLVITFLMAICMAVGLMITAQAQRARYQALRAEEMARRAAEEAAIAQEERARAIEASRQSAAALQEEKSQTQEPPTAEDSEATQ